MLSFYIALMKYTIVTLIKGEAKEYQQNLLYLVARKFNLNCAIQRKPPAHITLKYSFENDIESVEGVIERFCKANRKSRYVLKGVDHFGQDVIFIDVLPSKEMKKAYSEFITSLKQNTNIGFKQFDGTTHFHSTIAYKDIKDKFNDIWDFVSYENPYFELFFDNITILKLVDGVWRIHKEFGFKG